MSDAGFILLSALFLAVPVSVKYLLAFQTRTLVEALRLREREVQLLVARLQATEQECRVVGRAVRHVAIQRRQAHDRRELMSERLDYVRRLAAQTQAETAAAIPAGR
jgi:hypothetical protein